MIKQLQQKVLDTIKTNHLIEKGDQVVVGVSGGPDSVCLLHVLHTLSPQLEIKLHAVHINHMLRGDEALRDEDYTAQLCISLDIPLTTVRADVAAKAREWGMSLEEAGRNVRYCEFERIAAEIGAMKIAVAHNRDDQAETVMLRIIRGTGIAGLTGMEWKRGPIIRPLLNVYRKEIECYCRMADLSPKTDSTNLEADFTRNRVRLALFPYINKNFGADIGESLYRLSTLAAQDNHFIHQCAQEAYKDSLVKRDAGQVFLKLDSLGRLHPAVLGRVLRQAVMDVAGNSNGIGHVHYRALSELVEKGGTGARAELPGGLRAVVSYGILKILKEGGTQKKQPEKERNAAAFMRELELPGITEVPELDAVVHVTFENAPNVDNYGRMGYNSFVQFFDYNSLGKGINIRNRRNGDIFKPLKSNGTKKLKEYFIDSKIPRELRGEIPLICMENEIVWVVGYKISDKFKVTENTKSILRIEYNRRNV